MISILRCGPKLVVFGTTEIDKLCNFISDRLGGTITDLNSALEIAEEDSTVVLITDPGKKVAALSDVKKTVFIPIPSDTLFSEIINLGATSLISDSHISPGTLIMRTVGDFDKVLQSIESTYKGRTMSLFECLDAGTSNQTILSFTEKSLNQKISLNDLKQQHILIDKNSSELFRKMRTQVLRFLNEGLVGVDWNDLQIRIYDRYSKYKLHYDRLSLILDNIEPGLILGESWAKDYPRFLLSVLVYQIRLFTLLPPIDIKKILLGLEYLDDGTRIVDLDLIHRNNKIDWPQVMSKSTRKLDRIELGKIYRNEILDKLGDEDREKLFRMEDEILKSRY